MTPESPITYSLKVTRLENLREKKIFNFCLKDDRFIIIDILSNNPFDTKRTDLPVLEGSIEIYI